MNISDRCGSFRDPHGFRNVNAGGTENNGRRCHQRLHPVSEQSHHRKSVVSMTDFRNLET